LVSGLGELSLKIEFLLNENHGQTKPLWLNE